MVSDADLRCIPLGVSSRASPSRTSRITARDLGAVRIAFHRPEVRNAFRPRTVDELYTALEHARVSSDVGVVLITGNGPSPKDGGWAFCSGGDQRVRGKDGYKYEGDTVGQARSGAARTAAHPRGPAPHPLHAEGRDRGRPGLGRRRRSQPARRVRHDADRARATSTPSSSRRTRTWRAFDGGYGSAYLARMVGQKRAREIFFLGHDYSAREAMAMGYGQRGGPARRARDDGAFVGGGHPRQESDLAIRDAQVRMFNLKSTMASSDNSSSRAKRHAWRTAPDEATKDASRSSRSGRETSARCPGTIDRGRRSASPRMTGEAGSSSPGSTSPRRRASYAGAISSRVPSTPTVLAA